MHGSTQDTEALASWPAEAAGVKRGLGSPLAAWQRPRPPRPHPSPGPELTLVLVFAQLTQSTTPAAPWAALSPRLCSSSS